MGNKFTKIAQDNTLLSPIMAGKEKMTTDAVVGKEFTIIAFDFAPKFDQQGNPVIDETTGEVDTFGVVVFAEEPEKYYCVGTVFSKVCHAWMTGFDNPEEASKALAEEGGVHVKFMKSSTKKGNNLTSVQILD